MMRSAGHGDAETSARLRRGSSRRGTVIIAMLLVLIGLQLLVVLMVMGSARDQDLSVRRLDNLRAFYAAEAGINMAIREMYTGLDEDGDGTVGSISNDSQAISDPVLSASARVVVVKDTGSGSPVLTGTGRSVDSRCVIVAALSTSP